MKNSEIARKLFDLIEQRQTGRAAEMLTKDFTFSGPVPEPISGVKRLALHDRLNTAFPNWKFNLSDFRETDDGCQCYAEITGTQQGELDLSAIGMPLIPVTGMPIKLKRDEIHVTVQEGKISGIRTKGEAGTGVPEIYRQLGVEPPMTT